MRTYTDFLAAKVDFDTTGGFDTAPEDVHRLLMPHQRDIVRWAVKGGRRAIFAAFGLGKSLMQIETLRLVTERSGGNGRALIVCPLGVRAEFARDAAKVGRTTRFIRHTTEIDGPGLYVTNYESVRDGRLDPGEFDAVSLDEASVLRSFGSKTYQTFLDLFDQVPYRFVATATPSPNRFKELIHYAGFLGVTTPIFEELRTLTAAGHQSLLQSGPGGGRPRVSPADVEAAMEMVPEVLFRMFRPHEVAAGMAFPPDYQWDAIDPETGRHASNRDVVKAAGNAVTPPAARDLIATVAEAMGAAS